MIDQKKITEEVSELKSNTVTSTIEDSDIQLEPMKFLEKAIKRLHTEADFAAKNFDGKSKEFGSTLNGLMGKFQTSLDDYDTLVESHKKQIEINQEGIASLTLIPEKLQTRIESIAPRFAVEVEKIHSRRLETIIANIERLDQALKDSVIQNQKAIEETAKEVIRQMQAAQLSALESQKQQIAEFAQAVKEEVEAVTSNHGSKFLRNLAIALILATIAGGITSWCVGKYFPAFVQINKAGDIKVQHSAVKIWEADNPKISDSNQKTKVVK
jgi:hypothetical protein